MNQNERNQEQRIRNKYINDNEKILIKSREIDCVYVYRFFLLKKQERQ